MISSYNYLFVSDLHLCEGRDPKTGWLSPNEDFFHGDNFARFLAHHIALGRAPDAPDHYRRPWKLVLNGDIFDFLQVTSLPNEGDELYQVRGVRTYAELSPNERTYGLGTRQPEIIWKLQRIYRGHTTFFQALAWFLAHPGNQIVWMKGNHDIEIFWPGVQLALRRVLRHAYASWQQQTTQSDPQDPLPPYPEMLSDLSDEYLTEAILFPPSIIYEAGLFYAEHGCQYESANAFQDFENPILPGDDSSGQDDRVELPTGSLFVRYFFNRVEETHPFADNIKPISRYVKWMVFNAPSAVIRFLLEFLPSYLRASWETAKKQRQSANAVRKSNQTLSGNAPGSDPLNEAVRAGILQVQQNSQQQMKQATRRAGIGTLVSVLLTVGGLFLLFLAIRADSWLILLGGIGLALLLFFFGALLSRFLDDTLAKPYLFQSAGKIARLMEEKGDGAAPFFVFGHDHHASARPITAVSSPTSPIWYVNTGSWTPLFSEEDRLMRGDEHLTFLRLIPDKPGFRQSPPELLEWPAQATTPQPVRLFRPTTDPTARLTDFSDEPVEMKGQ
jgi:UDP-2,3-diacylglucosamine pyrophosphatase LpxH